MIKENIERVRQRLAEVCARIKSDPDKIVVVCVTKGRSAQQALEVVNLGYKDIGENRVQEAAAKHARLADKQNIRWHMVGHLQKNKVKQAVRIFDLIQSVDSLELAQEIQAKDTIPVVFLTASTKPDNVQAIRNMSNCHYLTKPITSENLTDVLQRIMRSDVHI